ncbi:M20 family metallo-hydrolase [Noviherbaspirillum sp. CPCC 100848]|uniref:M20 family metallo-hydrolase n=1 Tax=Noviherbaspirillum album TaxID=3080276 RepID=A0ABU6JGR4_9BURK|nr:M20 family metallo-hydrolase [Noviherbaspirillum sp. CPCC 100848]MEC4722728.1 M20 family metallo-hydrolase [Noviherbaspirillum sp. CPCC 100848]
MQRELAGFGVAADGGVCREALTEIDLAARSWLCRLLPAASYEWMVDDAANLIVRRAGTVPGLAPVMTGSHMDTQPMGGWLDGAFGVIAGIEALMALDDAGIHTRRPIEVVAWTNEEGTRFKPGAMGSSAFAEPGRLAGFLQTRDSKGETFETACNAAIERILPSAKRSPLGHPVHAYIEAHIEQGPVLESGQCRLGVVTSIQGVRWYEVEVRGVSAHAGTTPMQLRHDAVLAAAELVVRINEAAAARDDGNLRLTVGRFDVPGSSINTIASHVGFSIDLRHPSDAFLADMEELIKRVIRKQTRCAAEIRTLMQRAPTQFDADVLSIVENAVAATGAPYCSLGSGAFHDAMYVAEVAPAAMLFVPSRNGISHNPMEDTDEADLVLGTRALAAALVTLANQ